MVTGFLGINPGPFLSLLSSFKAETFSLKMSTFFLTVSWSFFFGKLSSNCSDRNWNICQAHGISLQRSDSLASSCKLVSRQLLAKEESIGVSSELISLSLSLPGSAVCLEIRIKIDLWKWKWKMKMKIPTELQSSEENNEIKKYILFGLVLSYSNEDWNKNLYLREENVDKNGKKDLCKFSQHQRRLKSPFHIF